MNINYTFTITNEEVTLRKLIDHIQCVNWQKHELHANLPIYENINLLFGANLRWKYYIDEG